MEVGDALLSQLEYEEITRYLLEKGVRLLAVYPDGTWLVKPMTRADPPLTGGWDQ